MPEKLEQQEIIDRLSAVEGWEQQGALLLKRYEFSDFQTALDFVNLVGEIAEEHNHHPDIVLQNYNEVVLRVTTHEYNAITDSDFELINAVEARHNGG